MPTLRAVDIYTGAFATIINPLKYVIYKVSDPLAEVNSQTFAAPHPERTVTFGSLEAVIYNFKLLEMSGTTPIREVANFNFKPNNKEFKYRVPENVIVGTTVGWTDGATSATLDGSGGKADWRTWEIIVSQPGIGPLLEGINYTWDSVTGVFTLIDGNTIYNTLQYQIQFQPKTIEADGGLPPAVLFSAVMTVTADTVLTADDMGKKILLNPASNYIEVTMPNIATVVSGRVTFFETVRQTGGMFTVKIIAAGLDKWAFGYTGRTAMYICPNESFECYKEGGEWRVQNAVGNFLSVGEQVSSDLDDLMGGVVMNGSDYNIKQYARLYEDYVLRLPATAYVTYAAWSTTTNQSKWSTSNGGLPEVAKLPDRTDRHERNSGVGNSGARLEAAVGTHQHIAPHVGADNPGAGIVGYGKATSLAAALSAWFVQATTSVRDMVSKPASSTGVIAADTENYVKSYYVNKFVKV